MGIKLANLAPAVAAILDYPEATAGVIARFGRDAGLLTSGARGRHVPDATALDAAYLMIAMMVTDSPARAVDAMRDFGGLKVVKYFSAAFPDYSLTSPDDHRSLAELVAVVLTEVASGSSLNVEPIRLTIYESDMRASLQVGQRSDSFDHAAVATLDVPNLDLTKVDAASMEQARATADLTAQRYRKRVKTTKEIDGDIVIAVADLIRENIASQQRDAARSEVA